MPQKTIIDRSVELVKVDFAPRRRQPSMLRVLLATAISMTGSLGVDAALVAIARAVFSPTNGYVPFQFHDYARLTIMGVIIPCAVWPIVTGISLAPDGSFGRSQS